MDCVEKVFKNMDKIAVYGAGYVGISLAAVYLRKNLDVILVDIDRAKLDAIASGKYRFIEKETSEAIMKGLEDKKLVLTSDGVDASKNSCIKVVTVPVYMDWAGKRYSFKALEKVSESIGRGLKRNDLVIIESSVPPRTTREIVKPILEETSGLRVEDDFYLAYSPERIYVGRAVKDIEENYPKIVSGIGPRSLEIVSMFYKRISRKGVIELGDTTTAEFEKLAEGIYRDVNIALANELAIASMYLGIDYYEVRRAANSQPYCHLHLPGPGVGGYCIPLYPYFAMNKLLEKGFVMDLSRIARNINEYMPYNVVRFIEMIYDSLNREKDGEKVCILGDAFRGDIDDTRLSPTHDIVGLLLAHGFRNIVVHDPFVQSDPVLDRLGVKLYSDLESALRDSGLVVVVTRHSMYRDLRISSIVEYSGREPLIIDTIAYLVNDINYDKYFVLGRSTILSRKLFGV